MAEDDARDTFRWHRHLLSAPPTRSRRSRAKHNGGRNAICWYPLARKIISKLEDMLELGVMILKCVKDDGISDTDLDAPDATGLSVRDRIREFQRRPDYDDRGLVESFDDSVARALVFINSSGTGIDPKPIIDLHALISPRGKWFGAWSQQPFTHTMLGDMWAALKETYLAWTMLKVLAEDRTPAATGTEPPAAPTPDEGLALPGPTVDGKAPAASGAVPPAAPPPELVTLDQAAAMVKRSKRSLEYYKGKRDGALPPPTHQGGGGRANLWEWQTIRPWLETTFGIALPESHPGNRPPGRQR